MPLTECPDCSNPISTEAYVCPKCGRPTARVKKQWKRGFVLWAVLVVVFLVVWQLLNDGAPAQ